MSSLIIPGRDPGALDSIARRMTGQYVESKDAEAGDPNLIRDPWQPRWRIDAQWIEFECGCRCERKREIDVKAKMGDAIIFAGLPEQAIYDFCCDRHSPGMNKIVRFSGYADFGQWKRTRKHLLMGTTKP